MQTCGQPPDDLVGEGSPLLHLDADGNPIVPPALPGMDDSANCSVMWDQVCEKVFSFFTEKFVHGHIISWQICRMFISRYFTYKRVHLMINVNWFL